MLTEEELAILKFLGSNINTGKKITLTPDRQNVINKVIKLLEKEKDSCQICGSEYINKDHGMCEKCCEEYFDKLG